MRYLRSPWMRIGLLLLSAAVLKIWLLTLQAFPFNSDEAIVGLMARHILAGERPVFFYGQAYMGSLDAWLTAVGFTIWGSQVWVMRLVQIILYSLTIIVSILIGRVAFRTWTHGLLAGVFLAFPAVNTTLYTTISLGGYGEALLIGSLGLLVGFWMLQQENLRRLYWMGIWGGLLGLGLWANGLSLVFFLPMGMALLLRVIRLKPLKRIGFSLLAGLVGFTIGSAPWWVYAIQNGFGHLIGEMGGTAVAVEQASFVQRSAAHLVNLVILGFPAAIGLRPPWEVRWLALPLLPVVLLFWIMVVVFLFRLRKRWDDHRVPYGILGGVVITLALLFVLTPFGVDPSGRYFLPLIVPLALGAAGMILLWPVKNWVKTAVVAVVVIFNLWGVVDCAYRQPPGITTQFYEPAQVDQQALPELIRFLTEQGATTGYSNYWVSYPLAFLTDELIVFTPRLPYHPDLRYTRRDERYLPYAEVIDRSTSTTYITTRNPVLDQKIVTEFNRLSLTWQEATIGEYHVYFDLSRPVHPEEIGLGEEQR